MRTYRPRFFCFPDFWATDATGRSEPTLPNLLIFHRIIKRFEEKLKGYRDSIVNRKNELEIETSTEIYLFSFEQWVDYEVSQLNESQKNMLGYRWLKAVVESFAQRRLQVAPIDEPCDAWISDLISTLS